MAQKITAVEGIGSVVAEQLASAGIYTVEALLRAGADPKTREDLAERSGIDGQKLLVYINMADLFRIKGIGTQYAELVKAAGVDTVVELSHRKPANLLSKMVDVNAEKKLVRKLPTEKMVLEWVAQAKALPRKISY